MIMLRAKPIEAKQNEQVYKFTHISIAEIYCVALLSNYVLTNDCQLYKFQSIILSAWKAEVKLVKSTFVHVYTSFRHSKLSLIFHSNIYSFNGIALKYESEMEWIFVRLQKGEANGTLLMF